MSLEKLLNMGGVQMMLGNLLKAAAPQLGEQVNEIAKVILAFKEQADRIEARQKIIDAKLDFIGSRSFETYNSCFNIGVENGTGKPATNGADVGGTTF
jgi:hypothetical protein